MAVLLIVDPSISSRGFIEADYWTTPASIYLCTQHQIQRSLIRLPSVVRQFPILLYGLVQQQRLLLTH